MRIEDPIFSLVFDQIFGCQKPRFLGPKNRSKTATKTIKKRPKNCLNFGSDLTPIFAKKTPLRETKKLLRSETKNMDKNCYPDSVYKFIQNCNFRTLS